MFVKNILILVPVFLNPVSTEQVVRECGLITVDWTPACVNLGLNVYILQVVQKMLPLGT